MSEMEVIIRQESAVKDHESQSPPTVGLKAGAFADVGTLILTNKRLVYINKGGAATALAWGVGGVFMAQAIEQSVSKAQLDEATTQPGSYSTPLVNITRAQAGKKMGQSFVTVENVGSPKPVHAYVVGGNNDNELWATAINQAKMALQFAPKVQAAPFVSQQAVISQTNCPRCGATNGGSKFCTSCGAPLMQTQNDLPLPPPPLQTQTAMCPYCRSPIRYIEQYQRWYCDKEKRYV